MPKWKGKSKKRKVDEESELKDEIDNEPSDNLEEMEEADFILRYTFKIS